MTWSAGTYTLPAGYATPIVSNSALGMTWSYSTWSDVEAALNAITAGGASTTFSFIDFNAGAGVPADPANNHGRLYAVTEHGNTYPVWVDENSADIVLNRDLMIVVQNTSGSSMPKGSAVDVHGSNGGTPTVRLARADLLGYHCEGVLLTAIPNNQYGYMMQNGLLQRMDTTAWSSGDQLYLSATPGALTNVAPTLGDAFQQSLGIVGTVHVSQGTIVLSIDAFVLPSTFTYVGTAQEPLLSLTIPNHTLYEAGTGVFTIDAGVKVNVASGGVLRVANWEANIFEGIVNQKQYKPGITISPGFIMSQRSFGATPYSIPSGSTLTIASGGALIA